MGENRQDQFLAQPQEDRPQARIPEETILARMVR